MDHYERLGVEKNATDQEIKKAYRKKAREVHPDKGGNDKEFAALAHSYETLKDPKRRLLYDETGEDDRLPIEKEIESALLELFSGALSSSREINVVEGVRTSIKMSVLNFSKNRESSKNRLEKLKTKRDKIKTTSPVNLAHMIIDEEIRSIEAYLLKIDYDEEIANGALAILDSYSEDFEPPPPNMLDMKFHFGKINSFSIDDPYFPSIDELLGDKK